VALVSVLPGSLASVTMSFNASGGALCLASNGSMHAVVDLAAVG
jgi:hypothetical protein